MSRSLVRRKREEALVNQETRRKNERSMQMKYNRKDDFSSFPLWILTI